MGVAEAVRRLFGVKPPPAVQIPPEAIELAAKAKEIERRLAVLEAREQAAEIARGRRGP